MSRSKQSTAEGQLAVDVFETDDAIVIRAPIAGVQLKDITISATDDMIKIRGERMTAEAVNEDRFFTQECYWGPFSRTVILPAAVDVDRIKATYRDGILRIEIPKSEHVTPHRITIQT